MSLKQSYHRYRIIFAKTDAVRFVGHLDLQSLFQKAIKRAKLPVAYSEGFNPHQLLSFAAPLPLGMAGHAEILEVFLMQEISVADITDALNAQMPLGLRITEVQKVPSVGRSAAALVQSATYNIRFSKMFDLDEAFKHVMHSKSIEVGKKGKKGITTVDIRPDIYSLETYTECSLRAVLACGSEKNLKPDILVQYILDIAGIETQDCETIYERLEIGLKPL